MDIEKNIINIISRTGDPSLLDEPETILTLLKSEDAMVVRIAAIVAASVMGFMVTDDETGTLSSDLLDVDYGFGPGAAVKAREQWIQKCTLGKRRSDSVSSIVVCIWNAKFWTWAMEMLVALAEEWSLRAIRNIPKTAADATSSFIANSPFSESFNKIGGSLATVFSTRSAVSSDTCECGCPWFRLASQEGGRQKYYATCLVRAATGKGGCGKWDLVVE
jgi:hypothetical protein